MHFGLPFSVMVPVMLLLLVALWGCCMLDSKDGCLSFASGIFCLIFTFITPIGAIMAITHCGEYGFMNCLKEPFLRTKANIIEEIEPLVKEYEEKYGERKNEKEPFYLSQLWRKF